MKVFDMAALFGTDTKALLTATMLDFTAHRTAHCILLIGLFVHVPTHCVTPMASASASLSATSRPTDTLATIVDVVFMGLMSANQIRNANALAFSDPNAQLDLRFGPPSL
ncbi:hypothetical protein E2562_027513 [Oryza meyeriana var. granulata]|uniref:LysM domain-containing protein n=1 Tax=Oryza meyeriana var. granulata TaxID=110450 RepID=A0A6G1E2M7_9ORYZ|nr:hypothetical protein E2562_027513 [Oryza meyeriana var. granulata]